MLETIYCYIYSGVMFIRHVITALYWNIDFSWSILTLYIALVLLAKFINKSRFKDWDFNIIISFLRKLLVLWWFVYVVMAFFTSGFTAFSFTGSQYEKKTWIEAGKRYYMDKDRCSMYDDISHNHLKFFMSEVEIKQILGPTPWGRKYNKGIYKNSHCIQYDLGQCYKVIKTPYLLFCSIPYTDLYLTYLALSDNKSEVTYNKNEDYSYSGDKYFKLKQQKEKNYEK